MKHWVFAKLCRIAYKSEKRINEELEKMGFEEKPIHISLGQFRCYIIKNGLRQYVIFKGTNNWEEWLNNFMLMLIDTRFDFKAHLGIWKYANLFFDTIKQHLDEDKFLYFSGHSLGGGLAVFNTVLAKFEGFKTVKSVVFGCPRLGDREFEKYLEDNKIEIIKFQNNLDLISNLPTYSLGYSDFGKLIYINRNNEIKENATNLYLLKDRMLCYLTFRYKELATDHKIQNYLDILKASDY